MTKEELIQFLKDNLKVSVELESSEHSDSHDITVRLWLGDDVISESYDYC